MDDNAEDCPVCLTTFDDTLRRPRNLPCGHTFCTPCINGLEEQDRVTCPTCRNTHTVPEAGHFPVSYITEAFIRRLRGAAATCPPPKPGKYTGEPAPSPVTKPGQKWPAGLSRPIRSMLQEQEAKVLAAIRTCQEVQAQLDQYQTTLVNWGERQQNLEDRLQALVDQSKGARVLVRQEESKVMTKKEQVQQGEQQLHALLQVLRTVATRQEACEAIDDADHCTDEERQRAEECLGMFPDAHTVTTINKVREVSSAALEATTTIHEHVETVGGLAGAEGDPDLLAAPDSPIMGRFYALLTQTLKVREVSSAALEATTTIHEHVETVGGLAGAEGDTDLLRTPDSPIMGRFYALLTPTLKAEDLNRLTQSARRLLQTGLVFAVHQEKGRSRYARMKFEDDHLYLYSLQDQTPPSSAVILKVDEVVPAAPPCLVFLDLAWPGIAPYRVLIRLSPDTPLGRQFLWLCTGQRGPCYANTRLWRVFDKGEWGERVIGGDYEFNNGTGGAALVPDVKEGRYRVSGKAGSVCMGYSNPGQAAMFCITTKDWQDGDWSDVFGEVVDGLEGLAAAAQHRPIREVTVVDCGVVLWPELTQVEEMITSDVVNISQWWASLT